jgi:hypothetical protein
VEWAHSLKVAPRSREAHRLTDNALDVDPLLDFGYNIVLHERVA